MRSTAEGTPCISADVPLSTEGAAALVVGSFTVDGSTYAIVGGGQAELVSAHLERNNDDGADIAADAVDAPGTAGADGAADLAGAANLAGIAANPTASAADLADPADAAVDAAGSTGAADVAADATPEVHLADPVAFELPSAVDYGGCTYAVTGVGPHAFAASAPVRVTLPPSVASVDERAFRGSAVTWLDVDPANPTYASYDGALYSADLTRLLSIPGGRAGAVRISDNVEEVAAGALSHSTLVDAFAMDADGAAYASWDGLLYDSTGQTLVKVPPGAAEAAIREGCTTVAAGALEGCSALRVLTVPSSMASVSPNVLEAVPPVTAPLASALADATGASAAEEAGAEEGEEASGSQGLRVGAEADAAYELSAVGASTANSAALRASALVALMSLEDLPKVDPASIAVSISQGADPAPWQALGFQIPEGSEGEELFVEERVEEGAEGEGNEGDLPLASLDEAAANRGKVTLGSGIGLTAYLKSRDSSEKIQRYYESAVPSGGLVAAGNDVTFPTYPDDGDYDPKDYSTMGSPYSPEGLIYAGEKTHLYVEDTFGIFLYGYNKDNTRATRITLGVGDEPIDFGEGVSTCAVVYDSGGSSLNHKYSLAHFNYGTGQLHPITSRTYLYLNWDVRNQSITYDLQGGSIAASAPTSYYFRGDKPAIPAPTRSGYTFTGWTVTSSDNDTWKRHSQVNGLNNGAKVTTVFPSGYTHSFVNLKLTANWSPNPITVNYYTKEGKLWTTASYPYGQGTLAGNPGWCPAGYTVRGWSGGANQTTASVGFGAAVPSSWPPGHVQNLYYATSPNAYTIAYHDKAGNRIGTQNATYDQALNLWTNPNRTAAGYTARGWSTAANQTTASWGFGARVSNLATSGTVNLYVAETANTYNVRYFTKAGDPIGTDVWTYGAYGSLRGNPGKTHEAYTAKGWARSKGQTSASHGFGLYTRNLVSAQGANFDLYLAETVNEYSISYDAKGGQLSGQRTKYTFETPDFQLVEPKRTGYTFLGWEVAGAKGTGVVANGASSTVKPGTWGNLSCTAKWQANKYEVVLAADFPAFAMDRPMPAMRAMG